MAGSTNLQRFFFLSLFIIGFYGMPAHAADAKLKHNPFWESVQPDVDVNGMVVVGLTSNGVVSGTDLSSIRISPPQAMAGGNVCLTVQSRDGVYVARNTYVLPASIDNNPVNLPYDQSRELDLLRKYSARHLGISVIEGDCTNPGNRLLKPFGAAGAAGSGLDIMVNGLGATDVFYSVTGTHLSGSCDALRDGRTTVFDFWCHISAPVQSDAQDVEIRIDRERYGRAFAPATLTLVADGQGS